MEDKIKSEKYETPTARVIMLLTKEDIVTGSGGGGADTGGIDLEF